MAFLDAEFMLISGTLARLIGHHTRIRGDFLVPENSVIVFADSRESSAILSKLEKLCTVKKICLSCGDYICSDRVIVDARPNPILRYPLPTAGCSAS